MAGAEVVVTVEQGMEGQSVDDRLEDVDVVSRVLIHWLFTGVGSWPFGP